MPGEARPSGTVTLLFTDIEGSTKLWESQPALMADAIQRHDQLSTKIIEAHNGWIFKRMGDGFAAVFPHPIEALNSAVAFQRALNESSEPFEFSVRMGLLTGAVQHRDGDYFGQTLNRVARLMGVAHGGQVLVSSTTFELIQDALSAEIKLIDLGEHRLKDLARPEHVYQLAHPALRRDFPSLRSLTSVPNNLPFSLTSFVGREGELEQVSKLMNRNRLVTLTGVGGSGKTRLALETALDVFDGFVDGVWLIELAPVTEETFVASAVKDALNVRSRPGQSDVEALIDRIADRKILIILDNCEHLLDTVARLTEAILRRCPNVQILVTSREPLGIGAESVYRVPALGLPAPNSIEAPQDLLRYAAVNLFVERAQTISPAFLITPENSSNIVELCGHLDGMPLAIELAAVRVKSLSVSVILSRINDRFKLLTQGSRTALPRQQTLRSLIDWSYDLLLPSQQLLLRRLSVFQKDWTLESAEIVCSDARMASDAILDLLSALVEKSLVIHDPDTGRYRMLETIRQYARELLLEEGDRARMETRHAEFFRDWILGFEGYWRSTEAGAEVARELAANIDDIRSALDWMMSQHLPDLPKVGSWLFRLWQGNGWMREGVSRFGAILESDYPLTDSERETMLLAQSSMAGDLGNYVLAIEATLQAIENAERRADEYDVCRAHYSLCLHYMAVGRFQEARDAISRVIHAPIVHPAGALFAYAEAAFYCDLPSCESEIVAAWKLAHEQGRLTTEAECQMLTARLALRRGQTQEAESSLLQSFRTFMSVNDIGFLRYVFEVGVALLTEQDKFENAAFLAGLLAKLHYMSGTYIQPSRLKEHESRLQVIREALGHGAFERSFNSGLDSRPEAAAELFTSPGISTGRPS